MENQIIDELLVRGAKYTTSQGEIVKITKPRDYNGCICYKKGTESFKSYYNEVIKQLYGHSNLKECFCLDFKEKCDEIVSSLVTE